MKHIAALLTVHNRKEKTLQCLQNLHAQEPVEGYAIDVWLTDDGCTDGTAEAVKAKYPDVNIIKGDGNLFWNRGMYRAWEAASKARDYDFYLWLNDDTNIFGDCLAVMINATNECKDQAIIVGTTRSKDNEVTTYGGSDKRGLITPNGNLQPCETFNGNCILVPRSVFHKLGNLDWTFRHAIGDLDYGHRATRASIGIFVAPKYVGYCERHSKLAVWARKDVSFLQRAKNLYSPLGYAEPIPFFHYERKNFGLLTALKHFITIHIRLLFPQLWKQ